MQILIVIGVVLIIWAAVLQWGVSKEIDYMEKTYGDTGPGTDEHEKDIKSQTPWMYGIGVLAIIAGLVGFAF